MLETAQEDSRNLLNHFKGLEVEQIVEILDQKRHPLHVAIENWEHDFNIGSIVRTANAFNVSGVHIIGRRRWNRRGAMKTDAYLHIYHHPDIDSFGKWARGEIEGLAERQEERAPKLIKQLKVVGIDILEGVSRPIEQSRLEQNICLLFGTEGEGLTKEAQNLALSSSGQILHITQYGSTRSINAAHAASISMYEWLRQNHSSRP